MENDSGFRKRRDDLMLLFRNLESLLNQMNTALDALAAEAPTNDSLDELIHLRDQLERAVRGYLDQNADFIGYLREQALKIEEAKREAAMAKKELRQERDQARIQELSDQLTTDLRLERIDNAIKELLDFLSDENFFAANASTGRRRRLRTLQNALDKALKK